MTLLLLIIFVALLLRKRSMENVIDIFKTLIKIMTLDEYIYADITYAVY